MHRHSPLLSILAAALITLGCGDDGGPPEIDAGLLPANQCINSGDLALLQADAMIDGGVPTISQLSGQIGACGLSAECSPALFEQDYAAAGACIDDCLIGTSLDGLSRGCLDCFMEAIPCASNYCVVDCAGTVPGACEACIQLNCGQRRTECTGLAN